MNDDRWFRLLTQAIGVLLLGMGLPVVLSYIGGAVYEFATVSSTDAQKYLWTRLPGIVAYGSEIAFGVYLIRGGGRLVPWCLARSMPK